MEERITTGIEVSMTEITPYTEPVSIADVKGFLNIDFNSHDTTLTTLIKAVRESFEELLNISLIPRNVMVQWDKFYDSERLPFGPVTTAKNAITVKDLSDVVIPSTNYQINGVGGWYHLTGDLPDGVKLGYAVGYSSIRTLHKQVIISTVAEVFTNKVSIYEALQKHCVNVGI